MTSDNLDRMLSGAFDEALDAFDQFDLTERVLTKIRRQQRLRFLVIGVLILIASAICVISALPLLGMLTSWFSQTAMPSEVSGQIPMVIGGIAAIAGASLLHLLVDDSL
jgi:hypothetical protein